MSLVTVTEALGVRRDRVVARFDCCDTTFTLHCEGLRARPAIERAAARMRTLEGQLDAFDADSAVSELNRRGVVTNEHVATLVERALAYRERTDGAFDVSRGDLAHETKAYIRGERSTPPDADAGEPATITVAGDTVRTDRRLDLNGLAKGYVVDRTADVLRGVGRTGFVDGGGDISSPTGNVAVESPFGDDTPLTVLATDWHVASSAGYRRRRGDVDHVYDPRTGEVGSRHDVVTVVAERDCLEADALATTLAATPVEDALALAESWPGLEALVVHAGVYHRTSGFQPHEAE